MGIGFILTLIFLVLQLCGVILWSWWFIFLPMIISLGLRVILIGISLWILMNTNQK